MAEPTSCADSPAALVAIARAARLAGDRNMERAARRELRERFRMELTFLREKESEVDHA
jgi:hypothetical protein